DGLDAPGVVGDLGHDHRLAGARALLVDGDDRPLDGALAIEEEAGADGLDPGVVFVAARSQVEQVLDGADPERLQLLRALRADSGQGGDRVGQRADPDLAREPPGSRGARRHAGPLDTRSLDIPAGGGRRRRGRPRRSGCGALEQTPGLGHALAALLGRELVVVAKEAYQRRQRLGRVAVTAAWSVGSCLNRNEVCQPARYGGVLVPLAVFERQDLPEQP